MEVPEDRCGFTTDYLPEVEPGDFSCWRPVWGETNRCIWHADVENKPSDVFRESRRDGWERLDQAIMRGVQIKDISFEGCNLFRSDFSRSQISETNFSGALISESNFSEGGFWNSDFSNCTAEAANFHNSNLPGSSFEGTFAAATDFSSANLRNVNFANSNLHSANFQNAELYQANFSSTNALRANFSGADLSTARCHEGGFHLARFENATLRHTKLSQADFEEADLTNADLSGADLKNAKFHDSLTRDLLIDEGTEFGEKPVYELKADQMARSNGIVKKIRDWLTGEESSTDGDLKENGQKSYSPRYLSHLINNLDQFTGRPSTYSGDLWKAVDVHQKHQRMYRENTMPDRVSEAFVNEQDARRKLSLAERNYPGWLWLAAKRHVMKYGESAVQVAKFSGFLIFASSIAYLFTRGIGMSSSASHKFVIGEVLTLPFDPPNILSAFGISLYYSISTFTTLGYGDVQPLGSIAKIIAGFEALAGATLIALFVAIFSRRIIR